MLSLKRGSKNKASRRSGQRRSVVIPTLCALLMGGVVLSTVMLGESLGRVTPRQTDVIFLIPPSKSAPAEGNSQTVYINPSPAASEDPSAVLAQREIRTYENRNPADYAGGTKLKTVSEAMSEYYKSQSSGSTGTNFFGDLDVTDGNIMWESKTGVDLFKSSYGGSVESLNGEKIIAPGTSNYYDFTVKNNGNIPLDYTISIEVDAFPDESDAASNLPLEWRLIDEYDRDITGWNTYTNSTGSLFSRTLDTYSNDDYTIEWRWQFERGDDEYDTYIGNLSGDATVGVDATIYVSAEQSAGWTPPKPPDPDEPDITPPDDLENPDLSQSNDDELIHRGQPQSASRIESNAVGAHRTVYAVMLAVSLSGLAILFIIFVAKRKRKEENTDEQS